MGVAIVDMNFDKNPDCTAWSWKYDKKEGRYEPVDVRVSIAKAGNGCVIGHDENGEDQCVSNPRVKDGCVPIEQLDAIKYWERLFKIGERVPTKPNDIQRQVYAFSAAAEWTKDANDRWWWGMELYLKIEPVYDDGLHRRSQRTFPGHRAIFSPALFSELDLARFINDDSTPELP